MNGADGTGALDWIIDNINAIAWTALGGFSIWGAIEQHMATAWQASRAGCVALAGVALFAGFQFGRWLVRHFELSKANDALDSANESIAGLEWTISGKQAALDTERHKNAQLASLMTARTTDLADERRRNAELTSRVEAQEEDLADERRRNAGLASRVEAQEEAIADERRRNAGLASRVEAQEEAIADEQRRNAELADMVAMKDEEISMLKGTIDELVTRWDREQQLNEDADRLLKLSMPEYAVIDDILAAEAQGYMYRHPYNEAIGHLYSSGVIGDYGNGDVYAINMKLRPFFERYAGAVHEIATGTNDDRLRVASMVRDGTYVPTNSPG